MACIIASTVNPRCSLVENANTRPGQIRMHHNVILQRFILTRSRAPPRCHPQIDVSTACPLQMLSNRIRASIIVLAENWQLRGQEISSKVTLTSVKVVGVPGIVKYAHSVIAVRRSRNWLGWTHLKRHNHDLELLVRCLGEHICPGVY